MICATFRASARALLFAVVCAGMGCGAAARSAAAAASVPPRGAAAAASRAPGTSSGALARRLCGALQTLPETRKAECCGGGGHGRDLAEECERNLSASLRDGSIAVDAADVERCERDSSLALAGCDWVTPLMPAPPPACRGLLHGRRASGEPCRSSLECGDGLSCRGGGPTRAGICASPAPPGSPCSDAPDTLETYARQPTDDGRHPECAGVCRKGRCTALAPIGGACSANEHCAERAHCVAGACAAGPPPQLGEPCARTACAGELACIDGRCAPRKKAGESCSKPFECEAACVASPAGGGGTCGMRCSRWPPAGYTPPHAAAPGGARAASAPAAR